MSEPNPYIVETTPERFQADVIDRSHETPVVVDFWAEWCAPCRLLGPVLEKLATEYDGKFVLVKLDTEQAPDIAAAFGVRSIPAVFGLRDGTVVDSFVGALPEATLRTWVDGLFPTRAEELLAEANRLEATDPATAEARYRSALELAPAEPQVKIGLARLLVHQGRLEEAGELIKALEARGFVEPEVEKIKAEMSLRDHARGAGGVDEARAAASARPDDLALKLKLAESLASAGDHREALDLCLDLVERDRKGLGESARKTMVSLFQLLPDDSDLAAEYRRKLAALLY